MPRGEKGKERIIIVKSISYDQAEIISGILSLHVPAHKIDLDPTFSIGNFYRDTGIEPPELRFDICPQRDDVVGADCRHLPLENASQSCIMFDPPFLATTGRSLGEHTDGNRIAKRFGVYASEQELHRFYIDSMKEFYRLLKPGGVLIFKCQDKISSGKQYMTHVFIANEAMKLGFYPKDLFILLAKSRLTPAWQVKNQKNARKFHSYFWVFEKSNRKIEYA